jgi:hypothetical protein
MIVSGSELATFNECEMQHHYKYVKGYNPNSESIAIMTGNFGHDNQEQFFKSIESGKTKEEALNAITPIANNEFGLKAASLSYRFCSDFNVDSGKPVIIEKKMIVPLTEDIDIGFTPDLLWEYNSGEMKLFDWKFTGRTWSEKAAQMHYQLPSYVGHLNRTFGYKITHINYVFFNTKSAEAKYKIQSFRVNDTEVDSIVDDQIKAADRLGATEPYDVFRINHKNICDYCVFQFPCSLERKGKDATETWKLMFNTKSTGYGYSND